MAECDHSVDDVVFLLKRNWFFSVDDMWDMLYELPEDVWEGVLERIREYPPFIQDQLSPQIQYPAAKELTDAEMNADQYAKAKEFEKRLATHKKAFVPPPHPRDSLDELMDEILASIARTEAEVSALTTRKGRKYVPPGQRVQEPETTALLAKIDGFKSELARFEKRRETRNKLSNELAWMDAVLTDIRIKNRI